MHLRASAKLREECARFSPSERSLSQVIYRIACTLQLVLFFFFACLFFRPRTYYCFDERSGDSIDHSQFKDCDLDALDDDGAGHDYGDGGSNYPYYYDSAKYSFCIPVLGIVIITILNDGLLLTIARDRVVPAQTPQNWDLTQLRIVAAAIAAIPLASSLLLLYLGLSSADGLYPSYAVLFGRRVPSDYNDSGDRYYMPYPQLTMMMYLKISVSDFLTLFCARSRGPFWSRAPSTGVFVAFLAATITASLIATLAKIPDNTYPMEPISSKACAFVWFFNLAFFLVQDATKLLVYRAIDRYYIGVPSQGKSLGEVRSAIKLLQ